MTRGVHVSCCSYIICAGFTWSCAGTSSVNLKRSARQKCLGTMYIPTQYELACLRSLNTESEERLFGQARAIADFCTNHHPENVIPQVMLRLQAKQEQHDGLASVKKGDSEVSGVAADLPQLPGTRVKTSFIQQREDS